MKYTAKILFISIAVLYILVLTVGLGLLILPIDSVEASLASTESAYVMLGLWIAVPVGLAALTATVILTAKPRTRGTREVKTLAYLSGSFVIGASLLLVVFLILTAMGILHPMQSDLILTSPDIIKTYDGTALKGSGPELTYGKLHDGHRMEVLSTSSALQVGEYPNAPHYRIVDESGTDVTNQYDIKEEFGILRVDPRKITLFSPGKSKVYDGTPLTADSIQLTAGSLVEGDQLHSEDSFSLTLPGTEPIRPDYRITSSDGVDVTNQYQISHALGDLTVMPVEISIATDSAQKVYDGKNLSAKNWTHTGGTLLEGHSIQMQVATVLREVGTVPNEGVAQVLDADGKDVTALYNINYQFGELRVQPIALYISTGSAQKVYDAHSLRCDDWELTRGVLEEGYSIQVKQCPSQIHVGSRENTIEFIVLDERGLDVTHRYIIVGDYGTLTVQPRAITLRTDSAQKVYDGKPLSCNTFQIVSGSLCEEDWVEIVGVSITNVGYSENYVLDCTVYHKDSSGNVTDVSACYRITFDFGMLTITAE